MLDLARPVEDVVSAALPPLTSPQVVEAAEATASWDYSTCASIPGVAIAVAPSRAGLEMRSGGVAPEAEGDVEVVVALCVCVCVCVSVGDDDQVGPYW